MQAASVRAAVLDLCAASLELSESLLPGTKVLT